MRKHLSAADSRRPLSPEMLAVGEEAVDYNVSGRARSVRTNRGGKMTESEIQDQDEWTRKTPLSAEELNELKESAYADAAAEDKTVEFTCDECGRAAVCHLAYDMYNTAGDCLWEK